MKNIFIKKTFGLILLLNLNSWSQCNPIIIPQLDPNNGFGGMFCLEGSNNFKEICLSNVNGNLNYVKKDLDGNSQEIYKTKLVLSDSNLSLVGLNPVQSWFNLSFDFESAGSASIKSTRGDSWDTNLQFLTNSTSNEASYSPSVRMTIDSEGRIGINNEIPNYILDVNGIPKFCDINDIDSKIVIKGANNPNYIFNGNLFTPINKRDLAFEFAGAGNSIIRSFRGGEYDTYLQFLTNPKSNSSGIPTIRMQINEDGKVIIGNVTIPMETSPYKLYLEGGLLTEKVKVALHNSTQWSDHVFDDEYKLMPLKEVEEYINKNKHLPNIPSSEKLIKEGLDLGEMQAKQMEKIEELTIYLIEMKKQIDSLKTEIDLLKNENIKLKAKKSKN